MGVTRGPTLEELEHLYSALSAEDRDDLLQSLPVAALRGKGAMTKLLEDLLLVQAGRELIGGLPLER